MTTQQKVTRQSRDVSEVVPSKAHTWSGKQNYLNYLQVWQISLCWILIPFSSLAA